MKAMTVVVLSCALLAACTSRSVHTWTGDVDDGDTRTITHIQDGTTRSIVIDGDAFFLHGELIDLPAGVTIGLQETGEDGERHATLRKDGDTNVLTVEEDGVVRAASDADMAWAMNLLSVIGPHDGPDEDELLVAEASDTTVAVTDVLGQLGKLSFDSDKVSVMAALIAREELAPDDQRAIVDEVWTLSFGSSQREVLTALVARDDFPPALGTDLIAASKQMSFESDRAPVLEALLLKRARADKESFETDEGQ